MRLNQVVGNPAQMLENASVNEALIRDVMYRQDYFCASCECKQYCKKLRPILQAALIAQIFRQPMQPNRSSGSAAAQFHLHRPSQCPHRHTAHQQRPEPLLPHHH